MWIRIIRLYLTLVCLFWIGGSFHLKAADRYVATNGTDSGACLTWATAASNIQFAVNLAASNDNDTVLVSNGTYYLTNQISITNAITVKGFNGLSNTLVAADWPTWTTRCFYVTTTATVDGFTISNGHYMGSNNYLGGGGMYIKKGTVQNCLFVNNICSNAGNLSGGGGALVDTAGIVSNCTFFTNISYKCDGSANYSGSGGGIFMLSGSANILSCTVISNIMGQYAGGIFSRYGGIVSNCMIAYNYCSYRTGGIMMVDDGTIIDCVISNNTGRNYGGGCELQSTGGRIKNCAIVDNKSGSGAGIYLEYGGTVSNCNIYGNISTNSGGGIYITGNYQFIIDSCKIRNNVNTDGRCGGGVYMYRAGQVRNCLISNNTNLSNISRSGGGGVYLTNASLTSTYPTGLINCTIVNNYSTNEGGGIATFGPSNNIVNCIVDGNSSSSNNFPNVYNNLAANSNNYWYSCATGVVFAQNQGNITNAPMFKDSGAGNWRLSSGSPCIHAGLNQSWMTGAFDLDGRTRIRYGRVDMGAYEAINEGTFYKFY